MLTSPHNPHFKMPRWGQWLVVALFVGTGAYIVGLYAGWVPWRPSARCKAVFCDPHHWPVLTGGLMWWAMAAVLALPAGAHRTRLVAALLVVGLMAATAWGAISAAR
jgi:hypothetical protein